VKTFTNSKGSAGSSAGTKTYSYSFSFSPGGSGASAKASSGQKGYKATTSGSKSRGGAQGINLDLGGIGDILNEFMRNGGGLFGEM